MDAPNSGKGPGAEARRSCEDCNTYSTHRRHDGLVFRFFTDEKNCYHRHIVVCPDHLANSPNLVN